MKWRLASVEMHFMPKSKILKRNGNENVESRKRKLLEGSLFGDNIGKRVPRISYFMAWISHELPLLSDESYLRGSLGVIWVDWGQAWVGWRGKRLMEKTREISQGFASHSQRGSKDWWWWSMIIMNIMEKSDYKDYNGKSCKISKKMRWTRFNFLWCGRRCF